MSLASTNKKAIYIWDIKKVFIKKCDSLLEAVDFLGCFNSTVIRKCIINNRPYKNLYILSYLSELPVTTKKRNCFKKVLLKLGENKIVVNRAQDVVPYLNIPVSTIYYYLRTGKIPASKNFNLSYV